MIVMLATSLYAARSSDEIVREAALVMCSDLKRELTGRQPSDKDFRAVTSLGSKIVDGGFSSLSGIDDDITDIMMKY